MNARFTDGYGSLLSGAVTAGVIGPVGLSRVEQIRIIDQVE